MILFNLAMAARAGGATAPPLDRADSRIAAFLPVTEHGAVQPANLAALIDVLGSDAPIATKLDAGRSLVGAGTASIPLLIDALGDRRVYERRDIANRMNLRRDAAAPTPIIAMITVGDRARELLYEVITPSRGSRYVGNFKVYSEQILQVDDWAVWWAANRQKRLVDIHAEMQPLVDAYWREHGTTQRVDPRRGPVAWDQGFPIPRGARRNDALGGSTTLAPGRNYVRRVYDVDTPIDSLIEFYGTYIPEAKRSADGGATQYTLPSGRLAIAPAGHGRGSRITVIAGPR